MPVSYFGSLASIRSFADTWGESERGANQKTDAERATHPGSQRRHQTLNVSVSTISQKIKNKQKQQGMIQIEQADNLSTN
jgi:hypothetical protein